MASDFPRVNDMAEERLKAARQEPSPYQFAKLVAADVNRRPSLISADLQPRLPGQHGVFSVFPLHVCGRAGLIGSVNSPLRTLTVVVALIARAIQAAENFPTPYDTEKAGKAPMSAEEAAKTFKMPPGFKVGVFASEPDVRQPIAMAFDPRGRLWVAENYTYAEAAVKFATNLSDRVVIFEDADNDGRFDKRTVFYDKAKILTSVELGMGGVFLMCPPKLLFVPDRNGDDVPDSEPEVLLDGFTTTTGSHHTFANGLRWGPDGWLWGRVGISSQARVGKPGTPESQRVAMNGGIWRYHPTKRVFQAVSHGTTNPWGMDWNEVGEPFFINTVIGHFWHGISGAYFDRMHGEHVNKHAYESIRQHADHYHFDTGAGWTKSRAAMDGSSFAANSDNLGGGHAHCGLMIYQGENWPKEYRGKAFTLNLHGRRINTERIEREGSGYVAKHGDDFLTVGDPWFRGIDLIQGPDGGVFIADWSDTGECHENDGVHRSSGRIYKVTYGDPKKPKFGDLTKLTGPQLLPLVTSKNEWVARQVRQALSTKTALTGKPAFPVIELKREFGRRRAVEDRLKVIWALNAVDGARDNWLTDRITGQTRDANENIRRWAIRLRSDAVFLTMNEEEARQLSGKKYDPGAAEKFTFNSRMFTDLAAKDPSPLVRLGLAEAIGSFPPAHRRPIAEQLLKHGSDSTDHNLPLLLWYGIEPIVASDPNAGVQLAMTSEIPTVRRLIARRLAEDAEAKPGNIAALFSAAAKSEASIKADIVSGLSQAWKGWRKLAAPEGWVAFSDSLKASGDAALQSKLSEINLLFGDGRALVELRTVVADASADGAARRAALKTLLEGRVENLAPLLKKLTDDSLLRAGAIIGLLQMGDTSAPALTVSRYPQVTTGERAQLMGAMVTRPASAKALLTAIGGGKIPKADLTPFHARQIAGLNDAALTARLTEVWGAVRSSSAETRSSIDRLRGELTPDRITSADLVAGRKLFTQACAGCHVMYGEGGKVGPDLTGSGRASIDYLLENIVDPSAVVPAEFRMSIVALKDDRILNGVIREKTDRTITLQNQTELATFERREIESIEESTASMMPEGLLESLTADQRRDLIGYLMHPKQVALP